MSASPPTIEVVFLAFDGFQTLDLTGPHDVFAGANQVLAEAAHTADPADRGTAGAGIASYHLSVVSARGGLVASESGLQIATSAASTVPADVDTFVVPGGSGTRTASHDPAVVDIAARLGAESSRTLTVCSGTFIAAAAGLLDGKRVTTHWARAESLDRRFPAIEVDAEPIYIRDGDVWSSAGVTAGIDLALAVVEHDHGVDVAQVVARWLVMFLRRPGGQSQFATPVWTERAELEPVRHAQDLVDAEPGGDHRVGLLADRVGMSERHFTRRFSEQVGMSPAQYVSAVRVEAARRALEATTDTIDVIAHQCGFGTAETMRRTFSRRVGASPDQYRQRFHQPTTERSSP